MPARIRIEISLILQRNMVIISAKFDLKVCITVTGTNLLKNYYAPCIVNLYYT